jgi:hypothetical protein
MVALVLLAAISVVGFVAFGLRKSETPSQRAARVVDCILDGNASCVFLATDERDRAAYKLSEEKVKGLLEQYVLPEFANNLRVDRTPVVDTGVAGTVVRYDVTLKSGRVVTIGTYAVSAGDEVLSPKLISQILFVTAIAKYPAMDRKPAVAEVMAWREAAIRDRELLTMLGFDGIFRKDEEGLKSWDEWVGWCDMVLDRFSNLPPPPKATSP